MRAFGPRTEGVLYHYTSQAAMYSIVESKALWASHVSYMNDASEITYAVALMRSLIKETFQDDQENDFVLEQLFNWLDLLLFEKHFIFSFSLSEAGNLLSQWRAYTPPNSGVSLGFLQDDLELYCKRNELNLIKCVYDRTEQKQILAILIGYLKHEADKSMGSEEFKKGAVSQELYPIFQGYKSEILIALSKIKQPLFAEEKEWRVVSKYYPSYVNSDIDFKAGKTTLIPYIKFDLTHLRSDSLLFEQVFVGPSSNFVLSFNAVSAFLSNKKACNTTINSSQSLRDGV